MNKKILLSLFAVIATAKVASAITMTFEPPRTLLPNSTIEEAGFRFSAPKYSGFVNGGGLLFRNPSSGLLNHNGLNTTPYNGSHYAVAFTGSEPVLQHGQNKAFRLHSLDLAEYSASFDDPHSISFTGYLASGATITENILLDGQVIGQTSDFQTFSFGSEWTNLSSVVMFASVQWPNGWVNGVGFSIDNISVSEVPDTGSTLLLFSLSAPFIIILTKMRRRLSNHLL